MNNVLSQESFGGNAGRREVDGTKYTCAVVNGYADRVIGEIRKFGNEPRSVTEAVHDGHIALVLGFTFDFSKPGIPILDWKNDGTFDPDAEAKIKAAIDLYNELEPARAMAEMQERRRNKPR
jgi:hypothetical protein